MTPRTRMAAIELTATLDVVMAVVRENQHSRYPIYEEDRDHIVGILHLKDLARWLHDNFATIREQPSASFFVLKELMRSAFFVPDTLALEQMLDHFRQQHIQIAIAVDEFGGTAGLITLEDLAEEIIGEIQDESDSEIPPFAEIDSLTLRVRGDLLLDELNQHYELKLEHDEAETVGGLIMDALGHMAEPGESVDYAGVRFEVESMEGLAVETALLYLPPPEGDATLTVDMQAEGNNASEEIPKEGVSPTVQLSDSELSSTTPAPKSHEHGDPSAK